MTKVYSSTEYKSKYSKHYCSTYGKNGQPDHFGPIMIDLANALAS